jgi:hypothetical protein
MWGIKREGAGRSMVNPELRDRRMNSQALYELVKLRLNTKQAGMLTYFKDVGNWQRDTGNRDQLTFQDLDELFCKPHKVSLLVIHKRYRETLIHMVNRPGRIFHDGKVIEHRRGRPTLGLYDDLTLVDSATIKRHACDAEFDAPGDNVRNWAQPEKINPEIIQVHPLFTKGARIEYMNRSSCKRIS